MCQHTIIDTCILDPVMLAYVTLNKLLHQHGSLYLMHDRMMQQLVDF